LPCQNLRRAFRPQGCGRHVARGPQHRSPGFRAPRTSAWLPRFIRARAKQVQRTETPQREDFMSETRAWAARLLRTGAALLGALALLCGPAAAKDGLKHVSVAVGGAGCLCYLPTMLAHQIGEYEKAGLDVELINFKGGSQALTAVLGGSADVVSGYYDHCVNLAAKNQPMQAFVTYDRYPALVLVVSP